MTETCQRLLQLADEENLLQVLIISDELRSVFHFELLGKVNKQNCWFWSAENPKEIHELHANKKAFWCGVAQFWIIGLYFFEDNGRRTITQFNLICGHDQRIFGAAVTRLLEIYTQSFWFQQDGATCHTSGSSMSVLRQLFPVPGHLIS